MDDSNNVSAEDFSELDVNYFQGTDEFFEESLEDDEFHWHENLTWLCDNCTNMNFISGLSCRSCGVPKSEDAEMPPPTFNPGPIPNSTLPVVIAFDHRMLLHSSSRESGPRHPERPARLRAILNRLEASGIYPGACERVPSREATREEIERCHTKDHVTLVESSQTNPIDFGSDTYHNEHSATAARLACGAAIDVAKAVVTKKARHGAAMVRPPGHHAERAGVMGFCLHNNASVATRAAQAAGAERVLILDWDVHHGNGTQNIFYDDPTVLYVSLHRFQNGRFYPGTGAPSEVGTGAGVGYSVNVGWSCGGVGDADYMAAITSLVLPLALAFQPHLTIISAGFDAACGDPIGGCSVSPAGYAHMTALMAALGPVELLLEGGYNLRSISASAEACIRVLLGETPQPFSQPLSASSVGMQDIMRTVSIHSRYWKTLVSPSASFSLRTVMPQAAHPWVLSDDDYPSSSSDASQQVHSDTPDVIPGPFKKDKSDDREEQEEAEEDEENESEDDQKKGADERTERCSHLRDEGDVQDDLRKVTAEGPTHSTDGTSDDTSPSGAEETGEVDERDCSRTDKDATQEDDGEDRLESPSRASTEQDEDENDLSPQKAKKRRFDYVPVVHGWQWDRWNVVSNILHDNAVAKRKGSHNGVVTSEHDQKSSCSEETKVVNETMEGEGTLRGLSGNKACRLPVVTSIEEKL